MKKELKQIIMGGYVATPIKNAANNKTAYWISKLGCTLALYMFTCEDCINEEDLQERLTEKGLKPYMNMLEEKCKSIKKIPAEEKAEIIGQIMDVFEDFLDEKGIKIPSSEKEKRKQDPDWEDNEAILYGEDYSRIAEELENMFINWGLMEEEN